MRYRSASLRGVAAFLAVLAAFCVAASGAAAAPLLWTLNSSKGTASTFNGNGIEVGSPIPVGTDPNSIAISPNGSRAVVVNFASDNLSIVDTAARVAVETLPLGSNGESVAISPNGRTAYVTDEGDEEVHVFNVETAKSEGAFKVGQEASAVAFAPDGVQAYVGGAKGLYVVDTATRAVSGPIDVGGFVTSIVLTPNGAKAFVTSAGTDTVHVISTVLEKEVGSISLTVEPTNLAVTPNGESLYILSRPAGTVSVASTSGATPPGSPIAVGSEAYEVAISPDGRTAYVGATGSEGVIRIDTTSETELLPIHATGDGVAHLVVAPDQSPVAAYTAPSAVATFPASFGGASSGDEDGQVLKWEWSFGEGAVASGATVQHTYAKAGAYSAKLTVTDNEGCSTAMVFTGRTAYCSGGASAVTHPVTGTAPPAVCSARFHVTRLQHNLKNGTVRMQVKLRSTGFLLLFGKKVHAITRKVRKPGSMWLTVHARVELNKRLKKVHRARVQTRITFTPSAECGFKTVHRSFALLRAKRKHHH
jgi:DNA-binding beta-propeller fold protein YncE